MHRGRLWSALGAGATLVGALVLIGWPVQADKLPAPKGDAGAIVAPRATGATPPARPTDGALVRTVIVEWTIKKGREQDFLDYWSKRSTIANREGLIAEFLNTVEPGEVWPWMTWTTPLHRPDVTIYYNIGLWRDATSFQEQIGKFIDINRPLLDFEASRRNRIILLPQRWRSGSTALPAKDSDNTQ